ncbi:acriflavin resistance protein [Candidatus Vecturithrix granuli]|uniref:Acriflavin resistance protein n=1 Tax=Vecturithrix granuli TaxID=1499967 RepID=A0A081C903_VECG1|nr:acriflavin resistance protein [Candidatus Vecturithrix granuli]
MQLAKFSIKHRVMMSMIYILVVGFGIFGLTQLKLALFPDLNMPMIMINTSYSGVGPEEIEELITRPIEEAVATTENVDTVSSSSQEGSSQVQLEFDWGTDMDQAEIDVRNNLDGIEDRLPDDANAPVVMAFNTSMMPILVMAMTSPNLGAAELRNLGEDKIEPLLERINGVASASTMGGLSRQINVNLNPILLASYNLSAQDVVTALQKGGQLYPAGTISTNTRKFTLRVYSEYRSLTQIENVILTQQSGAPVRLKDVATVEDGHEELASDVRVNGGQGIILLIYKQSDANTLSTTKNVKTALPKITATLPTGTQFAIVMDQSTSIESSISNLYDTAIQALALTLAVIYIFLLNWRGSLIMSISMPISVIATFGLLMLADITLNIVSMAGLALAIGMLVDNSVVVLENIFRHRAMGKLMEEAADIGTSEVGMAIFASTLTTVVVFVPVLFVPGMSGELIRDMVITISFSLGVSIIVALTLVPLMAVKLLGAYDEKREKEHRWMFKRVIDGGITGLIRLYQSTLGWSIRHKALVMLAVIAAFALSFLLTSSIGGEFISGMDQSSISVTLQQAAGTPLTTLRQTALQLEQIIKEEIPEAESSYISFGSSGGVRSTGASSISLNIKLPDKKQRTRGDLEISDSLRKRLDPLPGVTYAIGQNRGPTSGGSAIEINIRGHDLEAAQSLAEQFQAQMQNIPGLVDIELKIKESVPQLQVRLNQDVLNDFMIADTMVAQIVSTAIAGSTAATYRESGDEYDINVQLAPEYRQDREALGDVLIPVNNGASLVPLSQLGEIEETRATPTIYRENQERYAAVTCNLSGIDVASARKQVEAMIAATPLPADITIEIGGDAEDQQKSVVYYGIAFLVSVVLVYMVMASQFESLVDPFIVMFTIPLCAIGVIGILYLTNTPMGVMALIGVVMLAGIAVNNGIVLVDYINQLRVTGMELYQAVEAAGADRVRPVLMTAGTTILGMLPLALEIGSGSELWAPLGRVVIGGLTTTTFLTLYVIPILYIAFERLGERVKRVFSKRPGLEGVILAQPE